LCGSSFLNERFKELVKDVLKEEWYLNTGRETIDQIIEGEAIMGEFERKVKRLLEFKDRNAPPECFTIRTLRDDPEKGFQDGIFEISK
jgi:hypothetical protein